MKQLRNYRSSDNPLRDALLDLSTSLKNWRLPVLLAWRETQNQYRRSLLGPIWLVLPLIFRIGALALIFSTLFDQPVGYYLMWLTCGIVAWEFISETIQSSCEWFTTRSGYIAQGQTPLGSLVIWGITAKLLKFFHTLPICFVVGLCLNHQFSISILLLPLGVLMLCLIIAPIGLILGMLVPRLRDVGPLVASLLQVAFFLTPVMWIPQPGILETVAKWNPFSHLISWVRNPISGHGLDWQDGGLFLVLFLILTPLSFAIFVRFRKQLAYWV